MKKYYVTGISGVGKSTIAEELNKRGIFAIDQDSREYGLCSWKHNETKERVKFEYGIGKEFLEANDWYCDIEKLKELLSTDKTPIFVCGYTANQDEYLNLFDKVFLLHCPKEVFMHRLDTRNNNNFGKHQSEKDHILSWYEDFEKNLIQKGVIAINSDASINSIVEEILEKIK